MSFPSGAEPDARITFSTVAAQSLLPISRTTTMRFVAPGAMTAGRFGLFEAQLAPNAPGAAPHYHTTFSESFYVLSGRPLLYASGQWTRFGPGDYVHVAEHGVHGFRNDTDEPASVLILFAPGIARERYFEELAGISSSGRRPTPEEMAALYARHDQVNLPE